MHNTHPEFVGLAALKEAHKTQLRAFEEWAKQGQWREFHRHHYDWWMFPIDAPSKFGFKWTVFEEEIAELKKDPNFLRDLVRGAELLAFSWGWDLQQSRPIPNPAPDQCWQRWPIRLYKATSSLRLFGCGHEFASFRQYGQELIAQGEDFTFNDRDLTPLFLEERM